MATVIYFDDQWKGSKVLHNYYYITHTHTHTHTTLFTMTWHQNNKFSSYL